MATDAPTSAKMAADRMSEPGSWSPTETRIYALQVAVEYINGDTKRGNFYKAEDVLAVADKFETWLEQPPHSAAAAPPSVK